jgi:hypothetical protein
MVVAREVFQLHFGKAREAVALVREWRDLMAKQGYADVRFLTDYVGEYYTLVMELTTDDLASYERELDKVTKDEEWRRLYGRLIPLVRSGRREIFKVVD